MEENPYRSPQTAGKPEARRNWFKWLGGFLVAGYLGFTLAFIGGTAIGISPIVSRGRDYEIVFDWTPFVGCALAIVGYCIWTRRRWAPK